MPKKPIDETGRRYGNLTVLREAGRENRRVLWECICDCGNTTRVRASCLRQGNTASCGCLRKESHKRSVTADETDRRYGKLVVIKEAGREKGNKVTWECLCDCGNTITVRGSSLRSGATRSCGCFKKQTNTITAKNFENNPATKSTGFSKKGFKENPQKKEYKRLAQSLRSQGMGYKEISEEFAKKGIPTLSGGKSKWKPFYVQYLLRD